MRYQSAPRNIYRHVILSEMKEATAALPLVRGPDRAQIALLCAAWWHSRPCYTCRRRAHLRPEPPEGNIRMTSKLPPSLPSFQGVLGMNTQCCVGRLGCG